MTVSLCIQSAAAAAGALCVAMLLLAAAVRHGVPDGKICCWFIDSASGVFYLFVQTRFIFGVLLGCTVAVTASICL